MNSAELKNYKTVQDAARFTLNRVIEFIKPGVSESDLVKKCDELQRDVGVDGYWYKDLPALVLVGDHTTLAISREQYIQSNSQIQETDLVTIDLNPAIGGYCGDYARTYYVEGGIARRSPLSHEEFLTAAHAQNHLHATLKQVASEDMSFGDLYQIIHEEIERMGFLQLDYLGHDVKRDMDHLNFIAPDVTYLLGTVGLFTLEPQIILKGGRYGFKHENIYYFKDGELTEL